MTTHSPSASHLSAGIWHVLLTDQAQTAPALRASHNGTDLAGLTCQQGRAAGTWQISVPVPPSALSDGLQTIVLYDANNHVVDRLAILAGAPLDADLRAEIALLRAELDLLKAAIRRDHHGG